MTVKLIGQWNLHVGEPVEDTAVKDHSQGIFFTHSVLSLSLSLSKKKGGGDQLWL